MTDPTVASIDAAFRRDVFVIGPDLLATPERHRVWDEAGRLIMLAEFAPRLGRLVLAILLSFVAFFATFIALAILVTAFGWVSVAGILLTAAIAAIAPVAVCLLVLGRRRFLLRPDEPGSRPLVEVRPVGRSLFTTRYLVFDGKGNCLAALCASHLYDLWRLRWTAYQPDQSCCSATPEELRAARVWEKITGYGESRWFEVVEHSHIPRVVRLTAALLLVLAILVVPALACVAFGAVVVQRLGILVEIVILVAALLSGAAGFLMRKHREAGGTSMRKLQIDRLIVDPAFGGILGKFQRQGKDRRVRLELIADREHLDRRVAVAVAVLIGQ